jgi:TonB family protein
MIGDEGQAAGSGKRASYEAVVLDFLNREMATSPLIQNTKSQSAKLDALVSDLLEHVITESDQPQAAPKTAPSIFGAPQPELKLFRKEIPTSKERPTPKEGPTPQYELDASEDREQMLARFMPPQEPLSESPNDATAFQGESGSMSFEEDTDPLSEYMRLQKKGSAQGGESSFDAALDSSRFEDMDDVLADYGMPAQSVSDTWAEAIPMDSGACSCQSADACAVAEESIPAAEEASTVDMRVTPTDSQSTPGLTENVDTAIESCTPSPEETTPATIEAEGCAQTEGIPASIESFEKSETMNAADAPSLSEQAPVAPVFRAYLAPKRALSFSAIAVACKSKAPWIALAFLCVLAVLGIPALYQSGNGGKAAESRSANAASRSTTGSPLGPNGETPAVPLLQVSPRYPELAIKMRESTVVVLELSINADGDVVKATPVSGSTLFHEEAVSAAMKWHYKPASLGGANVASKSRVTLNFTLRN